MNMNLLRQKILAQRKSLSLFEIDSLSDQMSKVLCSWPVYKEAQTVMIYLAMPDEPQTDKIISDALHIGKTVCVPDMQAQFGLMDARQIISIDDVVVGRFGVRVPKGELARLIPTQEIDLVVVPGLAYDESGNRMGFGAGYYDRYLKQVSNAVFLGLAWDFQVLPAVPIADHDIPVHFLLTPQGIKQCCKGKM